MKRLYPWLVASMAWTGTVIAQQAAALPVSLSAVQPRRWYLGISLGVPAYWRESVGEQRNLKSDNYKYEEAITLIIGRQLTTHWAVQAGLNGFLEPVATHTYQGVYRPAVFTTGSFTYGAAVAALPLLLRYNPRMHLGLDVSAEGWLGLTPAWQRLRVDSEQYDNGQLSYSEHINTQALGLHATGGVSLLFGLG